ncbi:MAG: catalase family peroxidase [Acetobacteraceae bacterium]|nr:catalase family peroxidase [Acetobacteraceae bacterium]
MNAMSTRRIALAVMAAACLAVPSARALDPGEVVDAFEAVLGPVTTYRPSHPKGLCAAGHFVGNAEGTRLSVAPVFSGQRISAIIRFGVAGANPNASDVARSTRGLAIRFETARGEQWDMANISAPIFGARTPEMLVAGLLARRPGPNGQPDAEAVRRFVEANPDSQLQGRWLASVAPPASWATTPYWRVNTFLFRGQDGQVRPARWVFQPVAGTQRLTEEQMRSLGPNFLMDEMRRRVAQGPVEFDMVLQFPGQGDDLLNPTVAWPDDRPRATVGRLTVTSVEAGPGGPCDGISFMNLDMEPGVAMSDDPTLQARAAPYAVSLSRRTR